MNREKPLDLNTLATLWDALPPTDGFADRVLAACDAPARIARTEHRRAPLVVAAAAMLLMLFAGVYTARPAADASHADSMAFVEPDLGSQPD